MNLKQKFSLLISLSLLVSCSVEKRLRKIDIENGPLPILTYLTKTHPDLFGHKNVKVDTTYKDSLYLTKNELNQLFNDIVPNTFVPKHDGVIMANNDSLILNNIKPKKSKYIKFVKSGKDTIKVVSQVPVIINKPCPPCPDVSKVEKIVEKQNIPIIIIILATIGSMSVAFLPLFILLKLNNKNKSPN